MVCDFESQAIIVLDQIFKEKSRLTMPHNVWDVAVLDDNGIIVSLTHLKKLQIVEVVPKLKLKSCIKVEKNCFDVKIIDSKIYVVCTDDPGNGEISVLDMDGNIMKRLDLNKEGAYIFKFPINMASNRFHDKIYVSDLWTKSTQVVCMTVDGNVLFYR